VAREQLCAQHPPLYAWMLILPWLWISRWLDDVSQDCGLFIIVNPL